MPIQRHLLAVASACLLGVGSLADAETLVIRQLGDGGWKAEDCRLNEASPGNDLVGPKSTHLTSPAKPAVATDDAILAAMIDFRDASRGVPEGATLGGAVLLTTPTGGSVPNNGKVTLATLNGEKGFTTGAWHKEFRASYRWLGVEGPTAAPLLKVAVRSPKWGSEEGQSQFKHKPIRTGDGHFDLVLVLELAGPNGVWTQTDVSHDKGKWHLFRQHGNNNLPKTSFSDIRTLDEWAADPVWGELLFSEKTTVVNVQFGLGSGYVAASYIDWLEINLLNKGERIDFAAGKPLATPMMPPATQPTTKPTTAPTPTK